MGAVMTSLETLKAARQLITDPAKWTKIRLAKNSEGLAVNVHDPSAVCFCSMGALLVVSGMYLSDVVIAKASNALDNNLPKDFVETFNHEVCSFTDFNDTHTHAEVLALFDAAIAELEG
jgi:hypothetical protein